MKAFAQDLNDPNNDPQSNPNNLAQNGETVQPAEQNSNFSEIGAFGLQMAGFLILGLLGLILLWYGLLFWRRKVFSGKRLKHWKNSVIVEVSVPKETAEQVQKDRASQNSTDKEMVGAGEFLYSILAEYSASSFGQWFGGGPRFSFEIVNIDQEIHYWMVMEKDVAEVVERQVVALYPKANVQRINSTSFFKEGTVGYVQEMSLGNRFEVPFRTYTQMESDPTNTITNSMSGIAKDESAAIQLVLVPINNDWQDNLRDLATKINQGQNPEEILWPDRTTFGIITTIVNAILGGFGTVLGGLFRSKKEDDPLKPDKKDRRYMDISGKYDQINLTEQQRDIVKRLEEKASKTGFVYALRVIASARTKERAKQITESIIPAFQIYEIKPYNWITKKKSKQKDAILNFLLRSPYIPKGMHFWSDRFDIINTEEACSLWHIPNYMVTTPNIKWLPARKPAIPIEAPGPGEENVHIGTAVARGQTKEIYLKKDDRFRHIYTLGGSGSGKSVLMNHIILQDIANGDGVCVVDPHGELIDNILMKMPMDRKEDVIIFSPAFTDRPLGLNMLEFDPKKPVEKTLVIDTIFSIWDKLYDLKKTGGPMFENYMKNSLRLVMSHPESGSTLMEIGKVLSDEDFRSFKLAMCDEDEVVDFWEKQATKAGGEASLENMVPYITSKLGPFLTNDFIKPMIGQQKSAINFREAMDNKKIILVKLEKGLIGEMSAYLIGMVVVGNLLRAGMGRNDGLKYNLDGTTTEILAHERVPFFVYIDEMQNFLFDAIPKALEEIRKYKVGFYLAHQFVKQVIVQGDERIKDSIMANCASKFIFRCGAEDAELLQKEFAPTFDASDLMTPARFTYNGILLVDGQKTTPFNINSPSPDGEVFPENKKALIELTKQKYGKPIKEVEKEIRDRAKLLF